MPKMVPPSPKGYGELVDDFPCSSFGKDRSLIWGLVTAIAFVGCLGFAVFLFATAALHPKDDRNLLGVFLIVIGLLFLAGSVYHFYAMAIISATRTWIFENGVVVSAGKKEQKCRWEQIDEVCYWEETPDFCMKTFKGKEVGLHPMWVGHIHEVLDEVVPRVSQVLAQRFAKQLAAGEAVHFGRIEATREAIILHFGRYNAPRENSFYQGPLPRVSDEEKWTNYNHKKKEHHTKRIKWNEFQELGTEKDHSIYLVASGKKVPMYCKASDVPNSFALPYLAKMMKATRSE